VADPYGALYCAGLWLIFGVSLVSFPVLFFFTAPYGRHVQEGWGPRMSWLGGWILMELPAPVAFVLAYVDGPGARQPVPLVFLALWGLHYLHRGLVFPLGRRHRNKRQLLAATAVGFVFNGINGFCVGYAVSHAEHLTSDWAADPRFGLGLALMILGAGVNIHSDTVLRSLRQPGETGYRVPYGGCYRWVSSPNYLGEMTEWIGLALASWTLAGLAFAVFTIANLFPRALAHHRWYRAQFEDYPVDRKAILPRLL